MSDGVAKGMGKGAKQIAYGAVVGAGVRTSGLGNEGFELKSGNPLQKLETQMTEHVDATERAAPAGPPLAEAPKAETTRSGKPKGPRKKK